MSEQFAVAEARRRFAELIRSAEQGQVLEITRRGHPVAVIMSAQEYARLKNPRRPFMEVVDDVRAAVDEADLLPDEGLGELRDRSVGRRVDL